MPFSDLTLQTVGNLPNGTRNYGPVAVPDDVIGAYVRVARCTSADPTIWDDPACQIVWLIEISYDGGDTWERAGGAPGGGGIIPADPVRHPGYPAGEVDASMSLVRIRPGTGRLARGSTTVTGGPAKTGIFLRLVT